MAGMTTTTEDPTSNPTLAADDPRTSFAGAVEIAGSVIAAVRPDQMTEPTPCNEFDVRQMLGHLTGVLQKVALIGRGESPMGFPEYLTDIADDEWLATWTAAAHDVQAVFSDDALLDTVLQLPWAQLPGGVALRMYTSEICVHTWDIATATGQSPAWDDAVVAVGFDAMRIGLPVEGREASFEEARKHMPPSEREWTPPFAPAVEISTDAPLIDQLAAWTGRHPA